MPLQVEIITAEREVFNGEADMVVAPGSEGQLGILPKHAPLLTGLAIGELRLKQGGDETVLALSGGFMEVSHDQVTILADTAERAEDIDEARAEEARRRAEERRNQSQSDMDQVRAEASLQRALLRLKISQTRRGRRRSGGQVSPSGNQ